MKIAIQGEKGSFHELAAQQYHNREKIEIKSCKTFDAAVKAVVDHQADRAMIAIENARSGSILYNYSLIRESGLRVVGEQNLRIRQNLMALPGQSIDQIQEIWSHPVAIAQCMAFLNRYQKVTLIENPDTAGSARRIREQYVGGVAAIGATSAATLYDLEILATGIETYHRNYTRFLVLSRETTEAESADKASVCFSLAHEPGSLAILLIKLAEKNINLSKIQSVPKVNGGWEYLFYLDLEFPETVKTDEISSLLSVNSRDLEILGIYKKGNKLYDNSNS